MAIQVNGLFKNPTSNLIHESPLIQINVNLSYRGYLHIDAGVCFSEDICRDTIVFRGIDRKSLNFDLSISDPYDCMIEAVETFLISELKSSNLINQQSSFNRA